MQNPQDYLSKKSRNWNNNTIRIIERVCHKCDDMPSFFFRYFSHFCQLLQPLHSANSATSFCKQIRLILLTNSNLRANEVISSSQRNRIFKPAQSDLQASAVGCIGSMKRMNLRNEEHGFISLLQRPNLLKEKLFFSNLIPLISHLDLTI